MIFQVKNQRSRRRVNQKVYLETGDYDKAWDYIQAHANRDNLYVEYLWNKTLTCEFVDERGSRREVSVI